MKCWIFIELGRIENGSLWTKGDRCIVASVAFYNTSVIACHFPPRRWCIFLGGAWFIPPPPAFIIVVGRLESGRLMFLRRRTVRATACLIRTLFSSYHSQIISRATAATCNHRGLCQDASSSCPPTPTPTPAPSQTIQRPPRSFSCSFPCSCLQHNDSSEGKNGTHHDGEPNNSLHCWNSCSTSWVWPHLADSQHTHKSLLQFFFLFTRRMKIICAVVVILHLHFTTSTQGFPVFFFCCHIYFTVVIHIFYFLLELFKIWLRCFCQCVYYTFIKIISQFETHKLAAANPPLAFGCRGHNKHIHTCPRVHEHSCNKAGKDTVSLQLGSVNHLLVCMDSCSVDWCAPCMDMFKHGCRDIDVSHEASGGKNDSSLFLMDKTCL